MIIMLSGYMKSGKDTAGDHLCSKYGFKRFAFADVLKDEISEIYNIERSILDTQEGKSQIFHTCNTSTKNCQCNITIRKILINHGQERRAQDINYWVNKVLNSITKNATSTQRFVITDWRFENEYYRMKEYSNTSVVSWRIDRWNDIPYQDVTETQLDHFNFDIIIQNKQDLDELYKNIDNAMNLLLII